MVAARNDRCTSRRRVARAGTIGRLGPWLRFSGLGLLAAAVPLCAGAQTPGGDDPAVWIVDPKVPGARPAARRAIAVRSPVRRRCDGRQAPSAAVSRSRRSLHAVAGSGSDPDGTPLRSVLIPLGRSLQRGAAAPDYFRFPRVVVAVTGMPRDATQPLLKDRLYLGYQEKAGVLEVISYNEAAARFEFQVVKDYRAGGDAEGVLRPSCGLRRVPSERARRCSRVRCGTRPMRTLPWPAACRRSRRSSTACRCAPASRIRTPSTRPPTGPICFPPRNCSGATAAAPPMPAAVGCRAAALRTGARIPARRCAGRRHGECELHRWSRSPRSDRQWRRQWPRGLKVPNPDVPNRVPLPSSGERYRYADSRGRGVRAAVPREPRSKSGRPMIASASRLVSGLAEFIAASDVRRLDEHLRRMRMRRAANMRPRARSRSVDDGGAGRRIGFRCGSPDGCGALGGAAVRSATVASRTVIWTGWRSVANATPSGSR